jgi:trk system potassium uptake protein TrkH
MWLRLRLTDLRTIVHFVGLFVVGIGIAMSVPLVTALLWQEWGAALDYVLGIGVVLPLGLLLMHADVVRERITYAHAFAITALGWLVASLVAAVPLAFSGNYATYLDAAFDAVSGMTTSGLTVVTGLDHMAHSHNMWRHLTHLIGGQGIVVAALSLAVGLRGGGFSLYVAEARDERILPNILHTVRFIWIVTAAYVGLGTLALFGVLLRLGMAPGRGILHAFWAAIATYDTGGFGPQSMNAMYYHSGAFEVVTVVLMIAGALNFNLHAQVWRGGHDELWRNIEVRVLAFNVLALSVMASLGLAASKAFTGAPFELWRKGAYHIFSAHSGTGHQTVYANQWMTDMGPAFVAAVIIAMAAGGAASSTAGGIKALRLGLIFRTIVQQVKDALAPRAAVSRARYHHLREQILTPEASGTAAMVFIMYAVTYVTGGFIGAEYGYDLRSAMFESISATANVGLSTGITSVTMPVGLKLTYMLQMWAGRLEFLAVLALFAHFVLAIRYVVHPSRRA